MLICQAAWTPAQARTRYADSARRLPEVPRPISTPYFVGAASREINPDPDGTWRGAPVYLGGYGIGGGSALFAGRPATGILADGLHVRAFVVSAGGGTLAFANIETQGMFAADKDGPYGLQDIRRAASARTGGRLAAESVIVQASHTHAGPDTMGVWGGVPVAYRRHIAEQAAGAIADAYANRRRAALRYGAGDGHALLSNQFGYDAANGNDKLDSEIRVLQATDRRGRPFATLLNFSAHTTVLGSDNTKVSGDWVQSANRLGPKILGGGQVVTMVGTLGRTQPADRACSDRSVEGDTASLCRIDEYATRVLDRARSALRSAGPVRGRAIVGVRSYRIRDTAANPLIVGLNVAGGPLGFPFVRPTTPPWLIGPVLASSTASARIGDVLVSAGPGEMYPQIPLTVRDLVRAQGYLTAGLAGDQLGYLIAPYRAYPEPIRRSLFNERGDEISPLDNDNYFFNVSPTMGSRVRCSLLRGAGELVGRGTGPRDQDADCWLFANDLEVEHGADLPR